MSSTERKIAFKVEFSRILEVLSEQIYQSPFALLRENTQNAFDAIRMREALGHNFDPAIKIAVDDDSVTVTDNGIGMTAHEIETNFWYAGRSGKNNEAARNAGVVGTFGIGAMANFGVADALSVDSESVTGRRTLSSVRKSELSTDAQNISVKSVDSRGEPGTTVRAHLASASKMSIPDAKKYIIEFVEFVDVPVIFNGTEISRKPHRSVLPSEKRAWTVRERVSISDMLFGDLEVRGMASGELRVVFDNIQSNQEHAKRGTIVLVQDGGAIRALRYGFGLSTVGIHSRYRWGGLVDLTLLTPTAGREALDDLSNQLLQSVISSIDQIISPMAAKHVESFSNDCFLRWIVETGQFNLCGSLQVEPRPSGISADMDSLVKYRGIRYYSGRDDAVIRTYASEDEPLIVLSRRGPRRDCELGFLRVHQVEEVDTTPRVEKKLPVTSRSLGQSALATRVAMILEEDYFLNAEIDFGSITGRLPILVSKKDSLPMIYLDPESNSVAPLLNLFDSDYSAFGPFVKDFVRSVVFPKISELVPSRTREGAEAFLRHLRSNRELFEYELDDRADLEEIFEELRAGRLTNVEAARRLIDRDRSFVEVSGSSTAPISSVINDYEDSEGSEAESEDDYSARPGIDRRESKTDARILTSNTPINGYTCFLSLSDRVQKEKGDFFLQPHSTEVVWGGRKVIFIFQHHSKRFGLYYDVLCPGIVGDSSGGGPRMTSTILAESRTFIPVPNEISGDFLPTQGERKRLEVRCDILYLGRAHDS